MIGIFFGAFIAVATTNIVVLFSGNELLDGQMFLRNSLGSIFCGWFFSTTPLYFEMKGLQLVQQTALHFITVAVLYFILSFGIGWIPFSVKWILLSVFLFIVIYSIMWTCFYIYFKNEAKKLNDKLQHI
jgi:glucan phosphoethanolaminetransferase (alkaline phosphatase superfamily)